MFICLIIYSIVHEIWNEDSQIDHDNRINRARRSYDETKETHY